MKILLSLNQDLLTNLDNFCAKFGYQRSEFIRNCIRSEIFSQVGETVGIPKGEIASVRDALTKPKTNYSGDLTKNVDHLQKKLEVIATSKSIGTCKHGSAYGNCKFGCRKESK